ncbi:hypothetical protein MLD38_028217 [Melastoma candidum]|uniref:Uncharacterized protein n=1 Tax=Melastoma candidum TaxID=119954 RepID=A0ACB9N1P0_9MYRT|nr:hypothetical protein MLD38_028217 [Melastoma candidum]
MAERFVLVLVLVIGGSPVNANAETFGKNYYMTWGSDHVAFFDRNREAQLSMDLSSGAGFGSRFRYGSGFFGMKIKHPGRDSAGVVTAFYTASDDGEMHDEMDFEFLGNREGKPITLQTNVFVNGVGSREQRIYLWFDPTASFHLYRILWNPHQIVFYVDEIPIRVFKNKTVSNGAAYPVQPMQVQASLWNGDSWATDGGQTKTNWSYAPFEARFRGFGINGCRTDNTSNCGSLDYWWNSPKHWQLDANEQAQYEAVRKKYMMYDYCKDRTKYPTPPPECP